MKPRLLVALGSLATGAAIPVALMLTGTAAATSATPLCEEVTTSGLVNKTVSHCFSYGGAVICDDGEQGLDPQLMIYDYVCIPAVIASPTDTSSQ